MLGPLTESNPVAYFSMEIGLESEMPTYSGGLGVLAGDTLRGAADLGVPMVALSLIHRKGYFRQALDDHGQQMESPVAWDPAQHLAPTGVRVKLAIQGRDVHVTAWRYTITGAGGRTVPVFLLDTALPENDEWSQSLTDHLYGGDDRYRLCQEVVLGIGGVQMLRALGYQTPCAYHMNEGHAALLVIALLEERMALARSNEPAPGDLEAVQSQCVFTTHTPVPAGHDRFPGALVAEVLGQGRIGWPAINVCLANGVLSMTELGLHYSRYVNGVAMRHGQVSRSMFPGWPITSITNGVHAATWTTDSFQRLFDEFIPEWRQDSLYLRYALDIRMTGIIDAHQEAKRQLLAEVERRTGQRFDPSVFTIGFARRATAYKRMGLAFSDPERLRAIAKRVGPLQFVMAGKAHPRDGGGKQLIQHVHEVKRILQDDVRIVYLQDYGMDVARMICAGTDLWLNTPRKPQEASGTSGMKAALNGVPSFSVLDGWWLEGHVEGLTGWSIGDASPESTDEGDAESLYTKLENVILPTFYQDRERYASMQRNAIALNGSFFNATRMVIQYVSNAYAPPETEVGP